MSTIERQSEPPSAAPGGFRLWL
ncbi:hypothetical protein, partial [Cronobacter sakazakii]